MARTVLNFNAPITLNLGSPETPALDDIFALLLDLKDSFTVPPCQQAVSNLSSDERQEHDLADFEEHEDLPLDDLEEEHELEEESTSQVPPFFFKEKDGGLLLPYELISKLAKGEIYFIAPDVLTSH